MARRYKSGNPLIAVAYLRVSTDDQALGPEAQRAAIKRWAAAAGVDVVAVHEDLGVSGGAELDERPGLMAAIDALGVHGAGVLVVAKRDRLARSVLITAAVESLAAGRGARVVSADGTSNAEGPEGMLMRGLVDLFAQYERALIVTRTKAALAVKRSRGELVGSVPIGSSVGDGGRLGPNAAELAAVSRVRELRAVGMSVRAIAAALNEEGVPARGKQWHATTVARLLSRSEVAFAEP